MYDNYLAKALSTTLDERSRYLRRLVIRAFEGASRGHLGSSMSLIEILRVLYDDFVKYDPNDPFWEHRDRVILSKDTVVLHNMHCLLTKHFLT